MSDLYIELLVKKKKTSTDTLLKVLMIGATVIFVLGGILFNPIILLLAVVMGVVDYFKLPSLDLEYEYLYVNGELDIDKIMSKQKRKRVGSYDMKKVEIVAPKMEILAPENSHELDSFRNRKDIKVHDYSSLEENAKTFGMAINGDKGMELIYFDPNEAIIKDMQRIAPRSVKLY